jgi:hypothetical protein
MATAGITDERAIELAWAKVDRGPDRIERVYSWEVERILVGIRAALAVVAAVVGVLLTTLLQGTGRFGPWQILSAAASLGVSLGAVAFLYAKLGRLYGNYLKSLRHFAVVQRQEENDRWIPSRSP